MADEDSSDLSSVGSLSPPPPEIDEVELKPDKRGILSYFSKANAPAAADARKSPPPRKREPSPPHEAVFADNPDIAVSRNRVEIAKERDNFTRRVASPHHHWADTVPFAVHCYVPQAIRQCYASIAGAFRSRRV